MFLVLIANPFIKKSSLEEMKWQAHPPSSAETESLPCYADGQAASGYSCLACEERGAYVL